VYIGRAACAEPGRDTLLFRPTGALDEEGVDISIITQLLGPILAQRTADGTALFEAYGDQHRKIVAPDEIAVICIDLSQSMTNCCGFVDVEGNEDADVLINRRIAAESNTTMSENPAYHLPDSDELKEYMGRTSRLMTGPPLPDLEKLRQRSSHYHYRAQAENIERELNNVKNRCMRLKKYTALLCASLLTCVGEDNAQLDPLVWRPGDSMPEISRSSYQPEPTGPTFEIPRELCCHIGSEIMEDLVTTEDGFTYERKNIERW